MVVRMEPTRLWPFNIRSFFTNDETQTIGAGIELWRGYFQSIRPGIGRLLVNLDISTTAMYKPGPLLGLCLEFLELERRGPQALARNNGFPDRERIRLQRFISGVRFNTTDLTGNTKPQLIQKLTWDGASSLFFTKRDGRNLSVATHFQETYNKPLQYPGIPCVEVISEDFTEQGKKIVDKFRSRWAMEPSYLWRYAPFWLARS